MVYKIEALGSNWWRMSLVHYIWSDVQDEIFMTANTACCQGLFCCMIHTAFSYENARQQVSYRISLIRHVHTTRLPAAYHSHVTSPTCRKYPCSKTDPNTVGLLTWTVTEVMKRKCCHVEESFLKTTVPRLWCGLTRLVKPPMSWIINDEQLIPS